MERIKVYKVCQFISGFAYGDDGEEIVFAICTSEKYAKKAIDRLVEENHEDRESLYIVEDELILNVIYGREDSNLTED